MSATRILWGQILAVLALTLAGIWSATQWTAAVLAYQPELGEAWFSAFGHPVYPPWAIFWWWFSYEAYAPRIFETGGAIAASGGLVSVVVAIAMSVWRARELKNSATYGSARWASRAEIAAAGLLDGKGVVIGRRANIKVVTMQCIPQASRTRPSNAVLRSMFEARKRVFVDLLKWNVPVLADAYELDQLDTPDADYLILADEENRHRASARLLRTDRPHILGELFACLCDGPVPERPDLKEITRFCIEPRLTRPERGAVRNQLVTALVDHALETGLAGYTAVAGMGWFRQIAAFGWRCRPLGPELNVGGERLVALKIEIDSTTPAVLAENGICCRDSDQLAGARLEMVS